MTRIALFGLGVAAPLAARPSSCDEIVARVVTGSCVRRLHEMEASTELFESLGTDPIRARSTVEHLARMVDDGVRELPEAGA